jgi:hypothetical protein
MTRHYWSRSGSRCGDGRRARQADAGSAGWPSVESIRIRRPRGATAQALYERGCKSSAERVRAHAPLDGRALAWDMTGGNTPPPPRVTRVNPSPRIGTLSRLRNRLPRPKSEFLMAWTRPECASDAVSVADRTVARHGRSTFVVRCGACESWRQLTMPNAMGARFKASLETHRAVMARTAERLARESIAVG